jgi:hypothetical protein
MNTTKNKKMTGNFLLLQKLAKFGHIFHITGGYFCQGNSVDTNEKREKFSRSKVNEVKREMFL